MLRSDMLIEIEDVPFYRVERMLPVNDGYRPKSESDRGFAEYFLLKQKAGTDTQARKTSRPGDHVSELDGIFTVLLE